MAKHQLTTLRNDAGPGPSARPSYTSYTNTPRTLGRPLSRNEPHLFAVVDKPTGNSGSWLSGPADPAAGSTKVDMLRACCPSSPPHEWALRIYHCAGSAEPLTARPPARAADEGKHRPVGSFESSARFFRCTGLLAEVCHAVRREKSGSGRGDSAVCLLSGSNSGRDRTANPPARCATTTHGRWAAHEGRFNSLKEKSWYGLR